MPTPTRRRFIRKLTGYALLSYVATQEIVAAAKPRKHSFGDNVYTRLGAKPFHYGEHPVHVPERHARLAGGAPSDG